MELTAAVETEVRETIQAYATAYQKKDITTLSAIFSPTITGFGSGPDEVIGNHDDFIRQIKRDMSQATILSVEFTDRKIFGDGRVAWATSKSSITFTTDGIRKQTLQGRSTIVLRNTGSRWLIEQLHFSMPSRLRTMASRNPPQISFLSTRGDNLTAGRNHFFPFLACPLRYK